MAHRDPDIEKSLHDLAERQHGVVARRQADELGLPRSGWRSRMQGDDWELLTPRVARRRGSVDDDGQQAKAALLDAGPDAFLARESAAFLWGVPGYRLHPIHVVNPRRLVTSPLAIVHRPCLLPQRFAASKDGLEVVRPALLLLEMAPLVSMPRLHRMLDWFWARRLLAGPSVLAELDPVMHRGRPGTVALRDLIEGLPPDYVPPATGLESRFAAVASRHDLPAMRRQVDLGTDTEWCGRVDFRAVDLPLVVEVQSDTFHAALSSRDDDRVRRQGLEAAGFVVAEVWESQLWHRVDELVTEVRARAWEARALQARTRRSAG